MRGAPRKEEMEKIVFQAKPREVIGKQVKALRREGRLPAVLYGKSIQSIPVTLDYREASRILPMISSSHLVIVNVEGEEHNALIREKQIHPVQGRVVHVDFMAVSLTEKLHANVSIHVVGDAPAVREFNGVVVTGLEEVEVESLPGDLPERIVVDISSLSEIGSSIHVRDLQLPGSVKILTDLDEMLVLVTAPEAEEVVEKVEPEEPEVIERGKKEEED